jgi:hypothetical protein
MSDASGRAKDGHYEMFEDKGKQDELRTDIAAIASCDHVYTIPWPGIMT